MEPQNQGLVQMIFPFNWGDFEVPCQFAGFFFGPLEQTRLTNDLLVHSRMSNPIVELPRELAPEIKKHI